MTTRKGGIIVWCVTMVVAMVTSVMPTQAQQYDFYPSYESSPKVKMEFGIGIDAAYTDIANISSDKVSVTPRIGYGGHIDMALCIGRFFAIETEIAYQRGKVMLQDVRNNQYTLKSNTFDIPVLLSLRVANQHLRFSVGPLFTVMSKAQYDIGGEIREYGPIYPTWNLMGSIGVCIGRHFLIEGRYIYSLQNTYNQIQGEEFTARPSRITAGFSVIF